MNLGLLLTIIPIQIEALAELSCVHYCVNREGRDCKHTSFEYLNEAMLVFNLRAPEFELCLSSLVLV